MKTLINIFYEQTRKQLEEIAKNHSKSKHIYVFYDSSLVHATSAYLKSKQKYAQLFGIEIVLYDLYVNSHEANLAFLKKVANNHFIMFEFPLSDQLPINEYFAFLNLANDIDGIKAPAYLETNFDQIIYHPATVQAVIALLDYAKINLCEYDVCVIGRSIYLGNYLAYLLSLKKPKSLQIVHSKTENKEQIINGCGLVISCINTAYAYDCQILQSNAILIDVTTEYVDNKLVGSFVIDLDYIQQNNIKFTPVPGGIGKLTNLFLFANYFKAHP